MYDLLLDPSKLVGFKKLYIFRDSIMSYNPLVLSVKQNVPAGQYLYALLLRKDGTHVYELLPADKTSPTMLDIHYVEVEELQTAFNLGLAVFATEQEET